MYDQARIVRTSDIKVKPLYAALVLPPSPDEYAALLEQIRVHGMLHPITVNPSNVVLDGHTRLRVAKHLGLPAVQVQTLHVLSRELEARYAIEVNLARRHLNPAKRAKVGFRLLSIERHLARKRQGRRTDLRTSGSREPEVAGTFGTAVEKVARAIGLSPASFKRALSVQRLAKTDRSTAEEWRKALDGTGTIARAYGRARRALRESAQELQARAPRRDAGHDRVEILTGDMDLLLTRFHAEPVVDLVFTDPPYGPGGLGLWSRLGRLAMHALKPGGWLMAYAPQLYLPRVLASLTREGLVYRTLLHVVSV